MNCIVFEMPPSGLVSLEPTQHCVFLNAFQGKVYHSSSLVGITMLKMHLCSKFCQKPLSIFKVLSETAAGIIWYPETRDKYAS